MTKTAKLLDAFVSGDQLTTKQIKARYKLVNPSEAIRTLRESGYAIYANETKMSNGKVATKYPLVLHLVVWLQPQQKLLVHLFSLIKRDMKEIKLYETI